MHLRREPGELAQCEQGYELPQARGGAEAERYHGAADDHAAGAHEERVPDGGAYPIQHDACAASKPAQRAMPRCGLRSCEVRAATGDVSTAGAASQEEMVDEDLRPH